MSEAVVVVDWSSSCMMEGMVVREVVIGGQVGCAGAGVGWDEMQAGVVVGVVLEGEEKHSVLINCGEFIIGDMRCGLVDAVLEVFCHGDDVVSRGWG